MLVSSSCSRIALQIPSDVPIDLYSFLHRFYSPNSFLTLFMTLSFSGSYGWSLEGISSKLGKASLYWSTRGLMRSAICMSCQYVFILCRMFRFNHSIVATYVLVDQYDRNVLPLLGELVECFLDGGLLSFGINDKVVLLRVRSFGHMLREHQSPRGSS